MKQWLRLVSRQRGGATIAPEVEQLVSKVIRWGDLGGELRWVWILGYYTRIMFIQYIYVYMDYNMYIIII